MALDGSGAYGAEHNKRKRCGMAIISASLLAAYLRACLLLPPRAASSKRSRLFAQLTSPRLAAPRRASALRLRAPPRATLRCACALAFLLSRLAEKGDGWNLRSSRTGGASLSLGAGHDHASAQHRDHLMLYRRAAHWPAESLRMRILRAICVSRTARVTAVRLLALCVLHLPCRVHAA